MNLKINKKSELLMKSFRKIFCGPEYAEIKMKRFRILMFSYMFGAVHPFELFYVFHENTEPENIKSCSETMNSYYSTLNYLASSKQLKKLDDGYYILENKGIENLYEHLLVNGYIDDMDYDTFQKNCKRRSYLTSHSVKTGRSALSFFLKYNFNFLFEPSFDCDGNMIEGAFGGNMLAHVIPDVCIFTSSGKEVFFLEADSCIEQASVKISQKLSAYADIVHNSSSEPASVAIHFSVWNDSNENAVSITNFYEYYNILSLYDFYKNIQNTDISISEFISSLLHYDGYNESIKRASSFLCEEKITSASDEKDLLKKLKSNGINKFYTRQMFTRRKNLNACIENNPRFKNLLLQGMRLVFQPVNAFNYLYDFIYLENETSISLCIRLLESYFPEYTFKTYYKTFSFADELSGENFIFRNVFMLSKDNTNIFASFENISDDLSGYFRVEYYLNFPHKNANNSLYLFCLFNDFSTKKSVVFSTDEIFSNKYVFHIPYSTYLSL